MAHLIQHSLNKIGERGLTLEVKMATVRRDGSTAEKFKLTAGERVMLIGLIALAMMGLLLFLVGEGTIR